MDNVRFPCFGLNGGRAGQPGRFILNPGTPDEREVPPAGEGIPVRAGDLLTIQTGGGGGWGHPYDRDPADVLRDVQEGFVTPQSARRDYGVALTPDLALDRAQTDNLRQNRPQIPDVDRGPHAAKWLAALA